MTAYERKQWAKPNFLAGCRKQLDRIIDLADIDDAGERDVINGLLADATMIAEQRIAQHRAGIVSNQPDFPDDVSETGV